MKKIYTLASALLLAFGVSFAQSQNSFHISNHSVSNNNKIKKENVGKTNGFLVPASQQTSSIPSSANRVILFSSDFSAGSLSSWTLTPAGGNPSAGWNTGTFLPSGPFALTPAIASPTAANGYMMFDSDGVCAASNASFRTTNPINCSAASGVVVKFQQFYRAWRGNPGPDVGCFVEVSTTAATGPWTTFEINQGIASNASTANPAEAAVNISAVADGQAQVWIRIRFEGNCGYGWYVDDLTVEELPPFDVSVANAMFTHENIFDGFVGTGNIMMPKAMTDSTLFLAQIRNTGSATNVVTFTTEVLGTPYDSSLVYSLAPGDADTLLAIDDFVGSRFLPPSVVGSYTVQFSIASNNVEPVTTDNVMTRTIWVSDTTFSKEIGIIPVPATDYLAGVDMDAFALNSKYPFTVGNIYKIPLNATTPKAKSISFAIPTSTSNGVKFRVKMMQFVAGAWTTVGSPSATKLVTAADKPSAFSPINKFITLNFDQAIDLTPGESYLACVERLVEVPTDSLNGATAVNGRILTATGLNNGNITFTDASSTYIFGYQPGSPTPDALPLSWGENDHAVIRLNTVDCSVMTATPTVVQPTCNLSNGSVSIAAAGGNAPYSYAWTPIALGTNVAAATGLAAGSYDVTVTDKYGCSVVVPTATLANVGTATSATVVTTASTSCSTADGMAEVTITSGPAISTYTWSSNAGGQTTSSITGLGGGLYVVTFTNTDNCTATATGTVSQTGAPALTLTGTVVTSISCFGGNASVQLALSGAPAYPVSFKLGSSTLSASTPATFSAAANTYTTTATDNNGCVFVGSDVVLTQPTQLVNGSATKTNINCFGELTGSVTVTGVTGGTTPYIYSWSGAATGSNNTGSITGLGAGTYAITVKDANNCTALGTIASQVLTQPGSALSLDAEAIYVSTAPRRVLLTISGGTPNYTVSSTGTTVSPSSIIPIPAATYNVTLGAGGDRVIRVTDANGCFVEQTATSVGISTVVNNVENLSVYPNPTDNNVTISFTSNEVKNVTVKLVSLNGQEVFTQELSQFVGEYKKTVNMASQAQGVYFLQIISDKNVTTKKVVKL